MKAILLGSALALLATSAHAQISYSGGASYPPGACSSTTVGTTATQIIGTFAAGFPRNGGGFQLSPSASVSVVYSWSAGSSLTATTTGAFILAPGGTIPFSGAPNTALYAIVASGTASVSGGCMTE